VVGGVLADALADTGLSDEQRDALELETRQSLDRVRARRSRSIAHATARGRICNRPHAFGIECRASTPYLLTD